MLISWHSVSSLLFSSITRLQTSLSTHYEPISQVLRPATMADLNDITNITVNAFAVDPAWNWLFPYRLQYPDDHWHCVRTTIEHIMSNQSEYDCTVNVITSPTNEDQSLVKPIAVAIWARLNSDSLHNVWRIWERGLLVYKSLCAY